MKKNGMLVALMEEYRRASIDLKAILQTMSLEDFTKIRDTETKDPDCKSIQTVVFHIVQSGSGYANYVFSLTGDMPDLYRKPITSPLQAIEKIDWMLDYTESSFENIWYKSREEVESFKITSRWGVVFTFEQLMEHGIVHILRHRRQIENFLKSN